MEQLFKQVADWVSQYGYSAAVPALLADPGGIPWPWVALVAVAAHSKLNVWLLMLVGIVVTTLCDHALYWAGVKGGRPLLQKIGARFPTIADDIEKAETTLRRYDLWAIMFGRLFPLVGRFVGVGAALAEVPYARFAFFDLLGVLVTVVGFGVAAHFVGRKALENPLLQKLMTLAIIVGILFAVAMALWQWMRMRKAAAQSSS